MPLVNLLGDFRNSVIECNAFISIAFQQDSTSNYILPQNQRQFITDSSFLKLFIAWETFLEQSFISYMLGEAPISGNLVVRYVQPQDGNHANRLLIGTQKYVDWSNPDIVRRLSNLYFAVGNPVDVIISSLTTDLFDLKTVRNAAAHLTSTTRIQLDSLCARRLRRACSNMNVSDFIFSTDPDSVVHETILATYIEKLDVGAERIAIG